MFMFFKSVNTNTR